MSLIKTVAALQAGQVTPRELVMRSIAKIENDNASVNAVIATRFEAALIESDDPKLKNTRFGGVPILIKALGQTLTGMPDTASSKLLLHHGATTTSTFVARLQELGFIILGQTNAPEFGFKNTTDSDVYGITTLAHHPTHHAGGSSGGAAAALALEFVSVSAGSDGGGSLRIPASYHGLIALKPTRGSMPVGPGSYRGWQGASINFFLTTSIEDTASLFEAMRKDQPESPFQYIQKPFKNKPLRIAYSDTSFIGSKSSDDAKRALKKTIHLLESLGHTVENVSPQLDGHALMKAYYIVNGVETASMFKDLETTLNREITIDDVELTTWALYRYGLSVQGYEVVDALAMWDQASATMHAFHETYDFFLTPTTAQIAPLLSDVYQDDIIKDRIRNIDKDANPYHVVWDMFERSLRVTPFAMLANMTGQPAISLPLYKNEAGFHLGVQFIAAKGEEPALLDLSKHLEPYFENDR